jgi:hypothetical protein
VGTGDMDASYACRVLAAQGQEGVEVGGSTGGERAIDRMWVYDIKVDGAREILKNKGQYWKPTI